MTAVATAELPPLGEAQPQPPRGLPAARDFAVGALAGLVAYFALGFDHVFRPHYIGWLFFFTGKEPYYDPTTYFLGWHYFRHAPWTLPIGLNRDYGMEFGGSIVYSDSTPILAFLFKPFARWMAPVYQYQGIWILICFLLQGAFASLLASRFVRHIASKILIAGFFVLSPLMLERAWTEYAHMGQWLLLWAIYLYLGERRRPVRWVWAVLAILAVTTNFYYVPMVLMIWAADVVKAWWLERRPWRWLAAEGGMLFCVTLFSMWMSGYFAISLKNAQTDDFGKFATNLLGPIDPWGSSLFFQSPLPKSPFWLGEGYCYFGLGMLILAAGAFIEWLKRPTSRRAMLRLLPLIVVLLGLAFFSLSNRIAFGARVLELPNFWWKLGDIFRASGRMMWPAYYGLWLAIFYLTIRNLKPWRAALVLAVALCIQVIDLSPNATSVRNRYVTYREWRTPLRDPFWASAVHKYRRIVVVPSGHPFAYAPIAFLASSNGMPTNGASLARYPSGDIIGPISDRRARSLIDNKPDPDTLYIVPPDDAFKDWTRNLTRVHGVGQVNGYNVVAPNWFADGHAPVPGSIQPGAVP